MTSSCNVLNTTDMPVAEVVLTYPNALTVLTRHNIDYCCGGKLSFQEACTRLGFDADTLWDEIVNGGLHGDSYRLRFNSWDAPLLINFILQNHHAYIREAVPQIQELLDKVCSVHGADHNELAEIHTDFDKLSEELLMHMHKEEMILFPGIIRISQNKSGQALSVSNLELPIRVMEDEHEHAGNLTKSIRKLTNHYTVPPDACPTFELLYKKLEEFDQDLMQHIHVENNVLFERVKSN